MQQEHSSPAHPWEARFFVGLLILVLGFIGLVLTEMKQDGAWNYWRIIVVVNAILSIGLSFYLRRDKEAFSFQRIGKELLHWGGLVLAMYMVTEFVNIGLISRFLASLQLMILLAFSIFLAGVYIESTFLLIGLVLGLFCLTVAFAAEYLYYIILPVSVLAVILLFWILRRKHHRRQDTNDDLS